MPAGSSPPDPEGPAARRVHRPLRAPRNEIPWRESIADVVVIPEDADGHIDKQRSRRSSWRTRDRPLRSAASAPRATSRASSPIPTASPSCCTSTGTRLLGLRRRRPLRGRRVHAAVRRTPRCLQGRRLPLAAQVHRRPRHAGGPHRSSRAAHQPRPDVVGRGDSRVRQPGRARLSLRPVHRRRAAPRPSWSHPRRARLPAQGGGRGRRHPGARGGHAPPRRLRLAHAPVHRGAGQPRRRPSLDRVVRRAPSRWPISPPQPGCRTPQ